jgi:hypothetical protein
LQQPQPQSQLWVAPAQQLAPQQLPGQQPEFAQHAAPVAARAEKESSDAAIKVNNFVFMIGFLSVVEEYNRARRRGKASAAQNIGGRESKSANRLSGERQRLETAILRPLRGRGRAARPKLQREPGGGAPGHRL